ncbi:MAG: DNA mismatch repair protein MutS, partial [bacterium]
MKSPLEDDNTRDDASTPLMRQYLAIKAQHQDAILFFRMGDFYEMFYDDAKIASEVLGLTLTARAHGKAAEVPLAGFPHHALEAYLPKMVRAGFRVAICEQTEDPKLAKIIVKREVTEIVTPGTALADSLLASRRNNFLLSIHPYKKLVGIAQLDFSTGEFLVDEIAIESLNEVFQDIEPSEVLIATEYADWLQQQLRHLSGALVTARDGWLFAFDHAYATLTRHFNTLTLKGFGCDALTCGISAAGAALSYVSDTQKGRLGHITHLAQRHRQEFVTLDPSTRRNLELNRALRGDSQHATLLGVLDRTRTAMGGRMLVQWMLHPLRNIETIGERHDAVEELMGGNRLRDQIADILRGLGDLERLISKVSAVRASARELCAVRAVQEQIPTLQALLQKFESRLLRANTNLIDPLPELAEELRRALVDDPPLSVTEGNIFRLGYSTELDQLRHLTAHGKDWIAKLQASERERTGIGSLKVGYNKVFGYYLEVTNPNLAKVPDSYIRKQTLANAERYITPELKE